MRVIKGRGNKRQVLYEIPHASVINRSEPKEIETLVRNIFNQMG
jgi:hypothetical protein